MTKHQNKNKHHHEPKAHVPTHIPVLASEVLQYLGPQEGESYLDLTAGYGGHASLILERTLQPEKAALVDRDHRAISTLQTLFGNRGTRIIQKDFLSASKQLVAEGKQFDIILADLGVSSPHLDEPERGFALKREGLLDMRMDQNQELSAKVIVNSWSEAQLADLIYKYGEEPKSRKIARLITEHRPLASTTELAQLVARSASRRKPGHSSVHPATRTFQALRIVVNDELRQLSESLPLWVSLLAPGGRLGVISFHSLEDRIVKQFFNEQSQGYEAELRLLIKKPAIAEHNEIVTNPRARSAKLRAVAK